MRFRASKALSTNRSISLMTRAWSRTCGGATLASGCQAQCDAPAIGSGPDGFPGLTTVADGQTAPSSIQVFNKAISAAGSFPAGGMAVSASRYSTALNKRLSADFPGTIAGPESPPFNAVSRESSRRFPLSLAALELWHDWQRSMRTGRILLSKKSIFEAEGSSARAHATPVNANTQIIRTDFRSIGTHQSRSDDAPSVRGAGGSGGANLRSLIT